jgi:hypothetical protein
LATICLAAVLAFGLAACGGGTKKSEAEPEPSPPAAIDTERTGISDALDAASAAAGMVTDASTDEEVAAADRAVAAAMAVINDATLISGGEIATSRARLTPIQRQLDAAKASRTKVMNLTKQRKAISDAIAEATPAVRAVNDDSDDATVTAAEDAIADANRAIAAAGDILASEAAEAREKVAALQSVLDDAKSSRQTAMDDAVAREGRRTAQLDAITLAIKAATGAVGRVNDDSTQQQVDDANAAVEDANAAIADAADVSADVKDTHQASVNDLTKSLNTAVESRNAAIDAREVASQRTAISGAIAVAEAAVGAVKDDSDAATVTKADGAIKAARDAIERGTDLPAGETDTASETVKKLASILADAKSSRELALGGAAEKMRDRLIGKDRAIEAAANIGTAGPAEDAISISRGAGKKVGSVSVTAPAGYIASGTAAMSNPGWTGAHLERSVPGAKQRLFVYTDIEPPKRIPFYNFDGDPTTSWRYTDDLVVGGSGLDGATTPATPTTTIPALSLVEGGNANAALFNRGNLDPKFKSPGPAAEGNVVQRFPVSSSGSTTSFQGNFNGAAGTYTCNSGTNGQSCVVTITPGGMYTSPDQWTFMPELNSTAWRNDTEFLRFGWWMQEPNSPDGGYKFEYFAHGNDYEYQTVTPGKATYNGRAAGKYVVQEIVDGGVIGGEAGRFTAAATLTANFGPTNTISGTIERFVSDNDKVDVSKWEVTLHQKTLADLQAAFPVGSQLDPERTVDPFDGATAKMGDELAHGDWSGEYFGQTSAANSYPLGVGGTFQADNDSVSIGGAFGARRPKSE